MIAYVAPFVGRGAPVQYRALRQCCLLPHVLATSKSACLAKPSTSRQSHVIGMSRRGVDPNDEAFVSCALCGSDEIVSASAILLDGSKSVKCSQCKTRFTARAADAMTSTGTELLNSDATAAGSDRESDLTKTVGVKLFVGGLGPKVDSATLKAALEEFGEVRDAAVVFDKVTGRSKGFGFVTIVGKPAAVAAMDVLSDSSSILGSRIRVREAVDK